MEMGEAPYGLPEPCIGQVSVSHGHPGVSMAQERLRGSQVAKAHLDVACEGVPKVMESEAGDLRLLERSGPRPLDAHVTGLGLVVPEHIVRPQVPRKMAESL